MDRSICTIIAVGAVATMGTAQGPIVTAGPAKPAARPPLGEAHLVIGYRPGADGAELIPVHVRLGARVIRNHSVLHAAVVALPLDATAAAGPLHTTLSGDEAAVAAMFGNRTTPSPLSPDIAAAARFYAAQPGVAYVERDVQAATADVDAPSPEAAGAPDSATGTAVASDPYASQQWHLDATRLPEAWARSTADGIRIAVIDTGIESNHPDLAAALAPGWNATDGSADTEDGNGHGTAIAGVIAAVVGNGVGVAGAAPGARIVPIKALGDGGSGWLSDIAAGIVWAADHGAQVIVVAAGGRAPLRLLTDAVAYAEHHGALVVAAAGNSGADAAEHPAADPGALAVAALDRRGALTPWSNHGAAVRIGAPGEDILTTARGGGYAIASGTSLSAGIVGGVAALLYGQSADAVPAAIARRLLHTTAGRSDGAPGGVDAGAATGDPGEAAGSLGPSARLPGFWQRRRPVLLPAVYR